MKFTCYSALDVDVANVYYRNIKSCIMLYCDSYAYINGSENSHTACMHVIESVSVQYYNHHYRG